MADEKNRIFPWEKVAMANGDVPADIPFPEKILFLELRWLYGQHAQKLACLSDAVRCGTMTQQEADAEKVSDRERCIKEKKLFLEEYEGLCKCEEVGKEWKAILDRTESAVAEYRQNRTLENADRLLNAVLGRK